MKTEKEREEGCGEKDSADRKREGEERGEGEGSRETVERKRRRGVYVGRTGSRDMKRGEIG